MSTTKDKNHQARRCRTSARNNQRWRCATSILRIVIARRDGSQQKGAGNLCVFVAPNADYHICHLGIQEAFHGPQDGRARASTHHCVDLALPLFTRQSLLLIERWHLPQTREPSIGLVRGGEHSYSENIV